jgi:hypothetical protein
MTAALASPTQSAGGAGLLPLANPVTLGQALQHVGGLPDYIRSPAFRERFMSDPAA